MQAALTVESAGATPANVVRATPNHEHGKLQIVVRSGDVKQTRVYSVEVVAGRIDLTSDGVTEERPGAAPVSAAVASLALQLGPRGEIAAKGPSTSPPTRFASSADYEASRRNENPDEETTEELSWLFAPLPADAIGEGAKWRFEQEYYSSLGPIHEATRYELLGRDANELRVRVEEHAHTMGNEFGRGTVTGTVTIPLGAWRLPRGSFAFTNRNMSGTIEMTPID